MPTPRQDCDDSSILIGACAGCGLAVLTLVFTTIVTKAVLMPDAAKTPGLLHESTPRPNLKPSHTFSEWSLYDDRRAPFTFYYPSSFVVETMYPDIQLSRNGQILAIQDAPIYPARDASGNCVNTYSDSYQKQQAMLDEAPVNSAFEAGFSDTNPGVHSSTVFENAFGVKFAVGIDSCFAANPVEGTMEPQRKFVAITFLGNRRVTASLTPVILTAEQNRDPNLETRILANDSDGKAQQNYQEFLMFLKSIRPL
jgi:hypothetical protein